ncbi:MAG: hypothetical protein RR426_02690, partial [Oscillospiraceae bacterium]
MGVHQRSPYYTTVCPVVQVEEFQRHPPGIALYAGFLDIMPQYTYNKSLRIPSKLRKEAKYATTARKQNG